MLNRLSLRAWIVAVLAVAVAGIGLATAPAFAAVPAPAPATQPVALPDHLTRESVRELLSRLSDQQVRVLLIEQLDRAVTQAPASTVGAGMFGMPGMTQMAGMAGMVASNTGTLRERLAALYAAFVALPSTMHDVAVALTKSADEGATAMTEPRRNAGYLAAMLACGWIAQRAYVYALRHFRARLMHTPGATYFARAFQLGVGLAIDFAGIGVFALAAFAVYLTLQHARDLWHVILLSVLIAFTMMKVAALFARFLLDPAGGERRLLPFADLPARRLRRCVIAVTALFGGYIVAFSVLTAAGVTAATLDVLRIAGWMVGLAIVLPAVWLVRRPIADLIRGDGHQGTIRAWIADLWPVAATAYLLTLFVASFTSVLAGMPGPIGVGFASLLIVVALAIVDFALCRGLAAGAAARRSSDGAPVAAFLGAYQATFRRAIHIVIVVCGLTMLAQLWDLRLFDFAEHSIGGKIASSLLGISIVLLATYLAWEIARTAIDRRLLAEGERAADIPSTRLRTVLPLLRATILITIAVMATMSILAAIGVDILPLLAGASIVGVAIGFGAQTLVRDIVSGAFFLMDDAFRLGEYVEVGDAKGRVEKINLRSVFLRHHRGALNVLPYGEIHRLRNTSRDWMVHVMEFNLTYDTSMLQVKKILKRIGEELAADPDYAPDILQPLKSAGVMSAEDSAIVVRAKFTSRPTNNAWVVRRTAYDRIIREFHAAGIQFAHRQVTVNLPQSQDPGALACAGAAAGATLEPVSAQSDGGSPRG
jgi:small-conductance mechanosensitive channel